MVDPVDTKRTMLKFYRNRVRYTPAFPIAMKANAELLGKGWSNYVTLTGKEEVIWMASPSPTPYYVGGMILFDHDEDDDEFWIALTWVAPTFRKEGLYTTMWKELVSMAGLRRVGAISGGCHVDNLAMQKAMAKTGRKHEFNYYVYRLNQ